VKSSHTFKFGYETRRSTANFYSDLNSSGTYNFLARGTALNPSDATSGDAFASFLLDWPDNGSLLGVGFRSLLIWWQAGYAQDDWRITPKLTLNLGLRYERDTPLTELRGNYLMGMDLNATNPVCNCRGVFTYPKQLYSPENANFMPRLGFAYNVRRNTVIRGGFGTYFEGPVHIGARGTPGRFRPDIAAAVATNTSDNGITAPFHLSTGLPTEPVFTPSLLTPGFGAVPIGTRPILGGEFADPNLVEGYSEQFDFTPIPRLGCTVLPDSV
jgi:outer membrane receptor protein involved in Fe transport